MKIRSNSSDGEQAWESVRVRGPLLLMAGVLLVAVVPAAAYGDTISVPNTFSNGALADADEVNQNFDTLVAESNAQDVRIIGAENNSTQNASKLSGLASCVGVKRATYNGSTLGCTSSPSRNVTLASSAFTPQNSSDGYTGGSTGTSRLFSGGTLMFASVSLPDDATVTSMLCGGQDAQSNRRLRFRLRRNQPQVANVDMTSAESTDLAVGFQYPADYSVASGLINNASYNYYVIAEVVGGTCTGCSVGFCTIAYTSPAY
jgi:hypothetical protein